ncbi:unnamed protein product, partial [Adineta steineri]
MKTLDMYNDLVESNDHILDQLRTFLQSVSDTDGLYQFITSILKLIDKQTIDYQDPSKKNQQQDLISNERDQIEDLDVGFWCKRSILETSNFDERVAVTERFVQIAIRAYEKKNFAAVFAIIFGGIIDLEKSLPFTWDRLSKQSRTFVTLVDDMLGEDSHFKLYFEKLRQSPLPVVPFIANNQTRIAQMKEKHNMIVLSTSETLINFRKFQQIARIKRLNPLKGFQNYLVTFKEHIEPADSIPKVFPTRRPTNTWRSHSRVSRLFMIPSTSFTTHPRTSSQSDEQNHRKSIADM